MTEWKRMDFYGEKPVLARTIRKLQKWWMDGKEIDPWLSFPQNMCCFSYIKGQDENKYPLPIGVLKILWETAPAFSETCLNCSHRCYAIAYGGLLHQAAIVFVCTRCNYCWYKSYYDGLPGMARRMLEPLKGSEFCRSVGCYAGAHGADGKELLEILHIRGKPELLGSAYISCKPQKKEPDIT